MDWLLAALSLFNLVSMICVFRTRLTTHKRVPWVQFFTAALASELAWIWLPLQMALTILFCMGGALDSGLGVLSLVGLFITWPGLGWCIWQSTFAEEALENGLKAELGSNYLDDLPPEVLQRLRTTVSFNDWKHPFAMNKPGVEVIKNIAYGPHGIRQQLDIYRPKVIPEGGCPVLFQIHGGAWMVGDKGQQALPLMYHMASRGWICVAANYRLSPSVGFPTHLTDLKKALCWVRENGQEYGMDTSFIAVTGGSAGGHLAALMALTANRPELQPDNPDTDTSLQAAVPFYGVYDFLVRFNQHSNMDTTHKFLNHKVMHETRQENPDLWELASPIAQINEDAPPFMVVHGSHDSLAALKDGSVFSEKLRAVSKEPVVFAELSFTEHAFETVHSLRTEHTINAVQRFLEWSRCHAQGEAVSKMEDPDNPENPVNPEAV